MSNHVCICAFIIYNNKLYIYILYCRTLHYIYMCVCIVLYYIYITLYLISLSLSLHRHLIYIHLFIDCTSIVIYIYVVLYHIYMCVCYAHIIYIIYQICACNLLTSKHSWNMIPRSHASRKSPCRSTGCKRLQSRNGCLSSPLKSWLPCSAPLRAPKSLML